MKVLCLGGGPAGLCCVISMNLRDPGHQVLERNRSNDTFGWKVVLSDAALGRMARNDPVSCDAIREQIADWDDIAVVHAGACQVSGNWHFVQYAERAKGGAGLVVTEMTGVAAQGRITPGGTGLYTSEHEAAWSSISQFTHAETGAKTCCQIGHSGRNGSTEVGWADADAPQVSGNRPLLVASALPWSPGNQMPRAMDRDDMDLVLRQCIKSVEMAEGAGFGVIEQHAAHGDLLSGFISPWSNRRDGAYGGSLEIRMRAARPGGKPMPVRISARDWVESGVTPAEAVDIARMFAMEGGDIVDVAAGQTAVGGQPVFGRMFQTPIRRIRSCRSGGLIQSVRAGRICPIPIGRCTPVLRQVWRATGRCPVWRAAIRRCVCGRKPRWAASDLGQVLITGAAPARAFYAADWAMVFAGRRRDALDRVAAGLSGGGPIVTDVTDAAGVAALFAAVGPCQIVIANVGAGESAGRDLRNHLLAVTLTGTFLTFRDGVPQMGSGEGLMAIASVAGAPFLSVFAVTRHGVVQSMELQAVGKGITCNALCLGHIDTGMTDGVRAYQGQHRQACGADAGQPDRQQPAGPADCVGRNRRDGAAADLAGGSRGQPSGADTLGGRGVTDLSKRWLKRSIRQLGVIRASERHWRSVLSGRQASTLPRFEGMAALYRQRDGATMSDLSRLPMVLNGNASEVLNRLRADGRGRNLRHLERIARCGQRQSAGAGHLHAGPRFRTGVPGFCCPRRAGVSGRVRTVGRRGWGPAPRPPEYFCEVQMADGMVLAWSFPDDRHCDLAALETGCSAHLPVDHADVDASCRGLVACLVPADGAGLRVVMRIAALAPDPLAHLAFDDVMLPREALIGAAAAGFGTAMAVHAVFRPKIGAADVLRLNIARRVLA